MALKPPAASRSCPATRERLRLLVPPLLERYSPDMGGSTPRHTNQGSKAKRLER
jgi:hypothetical protein